MNNHVELWGWDGVAPWVPVLVDAAGRLQIDVTAASFPAVYPLSAAQIALLRAVTVGNFPADYPLPAAQVATLQQVTEQGTPSVHLYGYDTSNWQYLQVESDVLHNLRVKLYDGANGIDSDLIDANIFVSGERALLVRAQVCGYNLEPFHQRRTDSDALAAVTRELCQMNIALLYGYNGATFDRLRTESSTAFNLRVKLYDGANSIVSGLADGSIAIDQRGLMVLAPVYGYDGTVYRRAGCLAPDSDALATTLYGLKVLSHLYGYNGATFDRLRVWGAGVLKVGRAHIGLLTARVTGTGQVGAVGTRHLYWMVLNPSAGSSLFELSDAAAALQPIVLDHFDTTRDGHVMTLDPPMEFSTGIYLETLTNITSMIFGYR